MKIIVFILSVICIFSLVVSILVPLVISPIMQSYYKEKGLSEDSPTIAKELFEAKRMWSNIGDLLLWKYVFISAVIEVGIILIIKYKIGI